MKQFDRSKITEVPIKPEQSPIIDADRTQADHIRIQARILQEHRFKLRDQK